MVKYVPHREWSNGDPFSSAIRKVSECGHGVMMWAIGYDDGSYHIDIERSECVAAIDTQPKEQATDVFVSLRYMDPISKWWWEGLLNPETTLYQRVVKGETTIYEPENGHHHVAHIKIEKDTRLKEVVNLMIATRQASEWRASVNNAKKWYDAIAPIGGTFSEAVALSIMSNYGANYQTSNAGTFVNHGHSMFCRYNVPPRIAQRKPIDYPDLFRSKCTYMSDNAIWSKVVPNYYVVKPNKEPETDATRWWDLVKMVGTKPADNKLVSVFGRRIEEENNLVGNALAISDVKMLEMLRTFELREQVPIGYQGYDVDGDDFFDEDDDIDDDF